MKELTSREIVIKLGKGWGLDEFIDNYGNGSLDELKKILGKIHNGDLGKVGRDIKAMKLNKKRNKKRNKDQSANADAVKQEIPMYMPTIVDSVAGNAYDSSNLQMNLQLVKSSIENYKAKTAVLKAVEISETTSQMETETVAEAKAETEAKAGTEAKAKAGTEAKAKAGTEAKAKIGTEVKAKAGAEAKAKAETVEMKTENMSSTKEQLETLNNKLTDINNKIVDCEKSTKVLFANKRESSKIIEEIYQRLRNLEAEVNNEHRKFEEAYKRHQKTEKNLEKNKSIRKKLLQEKDSIESKIRELTVITVYCDSDEAEGSVCNYKLKDIEIDGQLIKQKVKSFFELEISDLIDEFSVSDLKRVAKIILTEERIKTENDTNVELWFSNHSNITSVLELMQFRVVIN